MVLVSILGDFHSSIFPIFFEFKDKLTHHIILHDDSEHDKKEVKKLIDSQKEFKKTYEENGVQTLNYKVSRIQVSENNYEDMMNAFKIIATTVSKSKNIYLNATDGLNSIAIVLSNKVLQYGGKVIVYDRYANTYNLHTKNTIKNKKIKKNIDIKNHLKLKGYKLKSYSNKFTLKKRKNTVLELTKNLKEYKKFAASYPNHEPYHNYYQSLIDKLSISKAQLKFFIDGTVFEEYIYWLIKDNIEVDDIMTGVNIEFADGFINEIDILLMNNNHLHFIECKFTKNFKGSEYIYKADSIMDHLDDDGKGMILTVGDKDLFTNGDKFRANNNHISLYAVNKFHDKKFLEEVKKHLSLS